MQKKMDTATPAVESPTPTIDPGDGDLGDFIELPDDPMFGIFVSLSAPPLSDRQRNWRLHLRILNLLYRLRLRGSSRRHGGASP
jgi:hypothetical protein